MAKGLWKNNIEAKEILLTLARVGVFTIAATSPYFLHAIIKMYFKHQTRGRQLAKQKTMRELVKRKYISVVQNADGTTNVELTHQGKRIVRHYNLETMKLIKPNQWDKQWRVLLYDIPNRNKKASDAFREKIKQLGLYQLQKSVWVSPYECIEEIEFLCGIFNININKHVLYFTTRNIPKEYTLKKYFSLSI